MILNAMIVEDEEWVRKGLIKKIQRVAEEIKIVGEAGDGQEAVHLLKNMKPDILITDIKLPVMDGIQLIKVVKDTHPYMKIIIISGFAEFELAQKAIKLGVSGYILKPVNEHDLKEIITKVADEINSFCGEGNIPGLPANIFSRIKESIINDDFKALEEVIFELFSEKRIDHYNLFHVELLIKQVLKCIENIMIDFGYLNESKLSLSAEATRQIPELCSDYSKLCGHIFNNLKQLIRQVKNDNQSIKNVVKNIISYVENHIDQDLSVEFFSRKYSVNLPYLSKQFKCLTGSNLSEFIVNKKIDKARDLLENTKMSITTIGEAVGFADSSYFFRVFKKKVGVTPTEYRKAIV